MAGPAVVVRPLSAGQATITVTAHAPQGDTAEGTFTVVVEAPTRADPMASIVDASADTLTLEFADSFTLDERWSNEVGVRQKAPMSGIAATVVSSIIVELQPPPCSRHLGPPAGSDQTGAR